MRDFKKYEVWKLSHEFALEIYLITKAFPKEEQYGIISQIRRTSVSIPTNISEGCGRKTDNEFARFIHIATGSANEVEYLLLLSKDLNFILSDKFETLDKQINTIKRKLYSLEKAILKQ
ncbi:MAG: four helix bundle protein [Bacteroidota bacterium]